MKLTDYHHARHLVRAYRVMPQPLADATGLALPWLEMAAGTTLLTERPRRLGALLAATLAASFGLGARHALGQDGPVPCGCAGRQEMVTHSTLIRAIIIGMGSIVLLFDEQVGPRRGLSKAASMGVALTAALPSGLQVRRRVRRQRVERLRRGVVVSRIAELTELLRREEGQIETITTPPPLPA